MIVVEWMMLCNLKYNRRCCVIWFEQIECRIFMKEFVMSILN